MWRILDIAVSTAITDAGPTIESSTVPAGRGRRIRVTLIRLPWRVDGDGRRAVVLSWPVG